MLRPGTLFVTPMLRAGTLTLRTSGVLRDQAFVYVFRELGGSSWVSEATGVVVDLRATVPAIAPSAWDGIVQAVCDAPDCGVPVCGIVPESMLHVCDVYSLRVAERDRLHCFFTLPCEGVSWLTTTARDWRLRRHLSAGGACPARHGSHAQHPSLSHSAG